MQLLSLGNNVVRDDKSLNWTERNDLNHQGELMGRINNSLILIAALTETEPISVRHIYPSTPSGCLRNAYIFVFSCEQHCGLVVRRGAFSCVCMGFLQVLTFPLWYKDMQIR